LSKIYCKSGRYIFVISYVVLVCIISAVIHLHPDTVKKYNNDTGTHGPKDEPNTGKVKK